ncbi:hypothetical protein N184_03385 [Sinorhizobium sp. GL28]|nr:hypothetical protein N184_03385 [Sinorhizobium sp. GL28]
MSGLEKTDDADPVTERTKAVEHGPVGDVEAGRRIGDGNERGNQDKMHFATRHEWSWALL